MNAEQIDLFVEESAGEIYIRISGTFGFSQQASFREKVMSLLDGPGKIWFLDIDKARFTEEEYLSMFLDFLEKCKQKNAELVLIFRGEENRNYFSRYSHIFTVTENWKKYQRPGIFKTLVTAGVSYSKQTGIRMSPIIAMILVVVFICWLVTLYGIIRSQGEDIRTRENRLVELENESREMQGELEYLQSMIGPLKNLGLVVDSTTSKKAEVRIRSWTKYLDRLEERRREK